MDMFGAEVTGNTFLFCLQEEIKEISQISYYSKRINSRSFINNNNWKIREIIEEFGEYYLPWVSEIQIDLAILLPG